MRVSRTTISCVTLAVFVASFWARPATAITFPLESRWSVTLPAPPVFPAAFDDRYAYFALQSTPEDAASAWADQLVALLIEDGSTAWSVECRISAPPAAGGGLVLVGGDGFTEARAQAEGEAMWRRAVPGRVSLLHWDTGWLLATIDGGPFVALRAADGDILWQQDFGTTLQAAPAPAGDRLYLPLKDGRLAAVSLHTGEEIWTRKLGGAPVGILPVGDRVFAGALDNQFYSFDADDGDVDWKWRTGADLLGLPSLDERRVYFVALDNVLRGHNRGNGTMLWKRVLPMRPFTGPLRSGDVLIVAGISTELRAYYAHDGKTAGNYVLTGSQGEEVLLAAPPHLTRQDSIIIMTKDGQVRRLASPPPAAESLPEGDDPSAAPSDASPADESGPPEPDAVGGAAATPDAAGGAAPGP